MLKTISLALAVLIVLIGCNKPKEMTTEQQQTAYWKTNAFCLYNEQNPSMRLKLEIPAGLLYPSTYKSVNGCPEERSIVIYSNLDELEAFAAKNTSKLIEIDSIIKKHHGEGEPYHHSDGVEVQLWMSSVPAGSTYFDKRLTEKSFDGSFIYLFSKNWLIFVAPRGMLGTTDKLTARIDIFHKNGLIIHLIGARQLDGEKVSSKRDQIVKNVISMVSSFNPKLLQ